MECSNYAYHFLYYLFAFYQWHKFDRFLFVQGIRYTHKQFVIWAIAIIEKQNNHCHFSIIITSAINTPISIVVHMRYSLSHMFPFLLFGVRMCASMVYHCFGLHCVFIWFIKFHVCACLCVRVCVFALVVEQFTHTTRNTLASKRAFYKHTFDYTDSHAISV